LFVFVFVTWITIIITIINWISNWIFNCNWNSNYINNNKNNWKKLLFNSISISCELSIYSTEKKKKKCLPGTSKPTPQPKQIKIYFNTI
jgi:hypothetical protein